MVSLLPQTAPGTPPAAPSRRLLWPAFAVLSALLGAYVVSLIVRPNGSYWTWLDGWSVVGWEIVVCALAMARGFVGRRGRMVALTLGTSLLCWAIGDLALTIESLGGATPARPSWPDLFYVAFYPLAYVGIVLFMRGGVRKLTTPNWLDGMVAGLGAAALCSAFPFHSIVHAAG